MQTAYMVGVHELGRAVGIVIRDDLVAAHKKLNKVLPLI